MTTTRDRFDTLLRRTLTEVSLVLAGAFDRFGADEEMVASVGRALADTFRDALCAAARATQPEARLHPAFAELLELLDGTSQTARSAEGMRS